MSNHPNRSKGYAQRRNVPSTRNEGSPTPDELRALREAVRLSRFNAARLVYATEAAWGHWESEPTNPKHRPMPVNLWELFRLKVRALMSAERIEVLLDRAAPPRAYVRIEGETLVLFSPDGERYAVEPLPPKFSMALQTKGWNT